MSPAPRLVAIEDAPQRDEAGDVRAAQRGDPAALRALFDRHHRAVLGYCLLATGRDRDRAVDLLQETFCRAFQGLGGLAAPERFRGWLFSIAANVCRTRGAQDERRRRVLDAVQLEQDPDAAVPDDPAEREGRIAAVQRVISHLPDPKLRQIVQLKYCEPEHTTREIAEMLAIPHGTVTVRLMRFRAAIRRELCRALLEEGVA